MIKAACEKGPLMYHSAPIPLGNSSIILPGNWGRIVRAMGEAHGKWAMEQTFEKVRQERYPDKPSRLQSAFCIPTEDGLRFYVEHAAKSRFPSVLYQVELVDPGAPQHLTDYNLIDVLQEGQTHERNAVRYWEGTFRYAFKDRPGFVCEELLALSPLRIVRRLE